MKKERNSTRNADARRATSYDVAREAGVSQSAVSRVFKDGASASQEMRKRVLAAAERVGYRPNAIARGLITRRSNMVAVIISRMTNLAYPEVLVQLTSELSGHDIRVLLFTIEGEAEAAAILDQVLQYQVDGVISAALLEGPQIEQLQAAGTPVVIFNRSMNDSSVSSVRCDQEEGERWLVGALAERGLDEFAIITGPPDSAVSISRTAGAIAKLNEQGLSAVSVQEGDYSHASGMEAFQQIHGELGRAPRAVICANDMMAIGCIDAARARFGIRVPDDMAVVGFDGIGPSRFSAYELTTVRQPIERMTRAAVEMLLERIEDPSLLPEERVFAGSHIEGTSGNALPRTHPGEKAP